MLAASAETAPKATLTAAQGGATGDSRRESLLLHVDCPIMAVIGMSIVLASVFCETLCQVTATFCACTSWMSAECRLTGAD